MRGGRSRVNYTLCTDFGHVRQIILCNLHDENTLTCFIVLSLYLSYKYCTGFVFVFGESSSSWIFRLLISVIKQFVFFMNLFIFKMKTDHQQIVYEVE